MIDCFAWMGLAALADQIDSIVVCGNHAFDIAASFGEQLLPVTLAMAAIPSPRSAPPPLDPANPAQSVQPPPEPPQPVPQRPIAAANDAIGGDVGDLEQTMRDIAHVERLRAQLASEASDLWRFHGPIKDHALHDAIHAHSSPVLVATSMKGGVGKTTLVANLAAYFAKAGLRVLVIDLDDQGALSQKLLRAAGHPRFERSLVDPILSGEAANVDIGQVAIDLAPGGLTGLRVLTASATLRSLEERLFMRWLLDTESVGDIRTNLARDLARPEIRGAFDLILIDTPPRRSAATVNALTAGTHVIMPVILDGLSINTFARQLHDLKSWANVDLNPRLKFAGAVTMKTSGQHLSGAETAAHAAFTSVSRDIFGEDAVPFATNIPDRAVFAKCAGSAIAYNVDVGRNSVQEIIDTLAVELVHRLT